MLRLIWSRFCPSNSTIPLLSPIFARSMSIDSPSSFSSSVSYSDALLLLDELQSNATTLKLITNAKSGRKVGHLNLLETEQYLHRLGHSIESINALNVIHIAGTKGKGSTAAFTESIIRHGVNSQQETIKTGLYTSPHLLEVRERIRINGSPISREAFAHYFFEVWDQLQKTKDLPPNHLPNYFTFLTCLAFHVFIQEKVNVLISEVGLGGRFDPTNVISVPLVTGITSLGLDHTSVLGPTLTEIAYQKAGIMKRGIPCFTVPQPKEAMVILEKESHLVQAPLKEIASGVPSSWKLGLPGPHQVWNAALALNLAFTYFLAFPSLYPGFLSKTYKNKNNTEFSLSQDNFSNLHPKGDEHGFFNTLELPSSPLSSFPSSPPPGLLEVTFPGRGQWYDKGKLKFWFDGAHTLESVGLATQTFFTFLQTLPSYSRSSSSFSSLNSPWLLFACSNDRDPFALLSSILEQSASSSTTQFHIVVLVSSSSSSSSPSSTSAPRFGVHDTCMLSELTSHCLKHGVSQVVTASCDELTLVIPSGQLCFVTGSFYLVGEVMKLAGVPVT